MSTADTLRWMATDDEFRLHVLLTVIGFDDRENLATLGELLPDRQMGLKEAVADYRGEGGKPPRERWSRLSDYVIEAFSGLSPTADVALGKASTFGTPALDDAAAEGIGLRWRTDLLDTAWRIFVAGQMRESKRPD